MLYLLLKFPMGIASFVLTVTLVSVTVSFLTAPLHFALWDIDYWLVEDDSASVAAFLVFLGVLLSFVTLHVLNFAAYLHGRLAYLMLGGR